MRWTSTGIGTTPFPSRTQAAKPGKIRFLQTSLPAALSLLAVLLLLGLALGTAGFVSELSGSSSVDKRISVYSTAANYSLLVTEHAGLDYVGILEILEPLGTVNARTEGQRWKLRYNNVEGEFTAGQNRARIRGKPSDLGAPFLLDNGRGRVPLESLTTLLPRFLGGPVTFHETARRLFIGTVATEFTATIAKTTPPRLMLNFNSPVNPTISTEPGRLRMVFTREPLVAGSQTLSFDDKTIPSATYTENNGAAEIMVSGTQPLMATFSNDGRTITIAPAPQAPPPPPAAVSSASAPAPLNSLTALNPKAVPGSIPGSLATSPTNPPAASRFMVVVDASHGGDERGAALTEQLPEKDVTLAVARRLRQELQNRGVLVLMLRDSDSTLLPDQRAAAANGVHPSAYICVHASSQGVGVRLYTAAIPMGDENRGPFVAWDTAQAPALPLSQIIASTVALELQRRQVGARVLSAPLRPLNEVIAPSVAVELAPPDANVLNLASPSYEELVAIAVANGVAQLRSRLEAQR